MGNTETTYRLRFSTHAETNGESVSFTAWLETETRVASDGHDKPFVYAEELLVHSVTTYKTASQREITAKFCAEFNRIVGRRQMAGFDMSVLPARIRTTDMSADSDIVVRNKKCRSLRSLFDLSSALSRALHAAYPQNMHLFNSRSEEYV